jgi:hypothetical protein
MNEEPPWPTRSPTWNLVLRVIDPFVTIKTGFRQYSLMQFITRRQQRAAPDIMSSPSDEVTPSPDS